MTLKKGDVAPEFSAINQDGKIINLKDYKGKKLVLYFYPKDNTPGCTAQSCNLRDNYTLLQKQGYEIIGISQDSEKSHLKFIEKQSLPFNLISDIDHKVHHLYGTWDLKKYMGKEYMGTIRTTFVIDEKGVILDVIEKVKTADHTAQILTK
ncbi:MAG: thioredoxin-dependent thiol peroxidase [Flammeovirgaceae bacterium]|nr:thioredoxin-dependent thiol peroxidase [Flammeovirgaceae bacterium]